MRPGLAVLIKHHFWLLSLLVPLVLLPSLFLARGRLTSQIGTVRDQIKGHITALQNVRKIPQHPNSSWANEIDTSTMRVKRETFAEWRKFWDSQQSLRAWPESLGEDFVKATQSLKPDGKLSPRLLERYQNIVRSLVRALPDRMKVEEAMGDVTGAGQGPPRPQPSAASEMMRPGVGIGPGAIVPEAPAYIATWNPENQQRIYKSFDWDVRPSTAKVLLAQEELWVYEALCDVVAGVNKSATGPHNAAISNITELFVGYPAAEDNPGGVNGGRIVRKGPKMVGDAMSGAPPDMMAPGTPGAPGGRPLNPRFSGILAGGPGGPGSMPMENAPVVDADEELRNWVYVDFSGKPMKAADLAAAVDSQMVHLMPFVLRVVIDQRQIDALLVGLATAAVPIDVRQVRINAAASGQPGQSAPAAPVPVNASGVGRLYDVTLELLGTVGLATPPNENTVGLEAGEGDAPAPADAGEKAAAAPKAAVLHRPGRRRITS